MRGFFILIFSKGETMSERILMDEAGLKRTLTRLSHEIVEKNKGLDDVCLIGIKRRGEIIANRLCEIIENAYHTRLMCAGIDIGMYRDDLVSEYFVPDAKVNDLGFNVDGKKIILCDDVLHTGRTVRAAIEAIFDLGRPSCVQLLVFCDRGGKEMPVFADYVGKNIPASRKEFIDLRLKEIEGEDSLGIIRRDE